jgi:hypothetical protein
MDDACPEPSQKLPEARAHATSYDGVIFSSRCLSISVTAIRTTFRTFVATVRIDGKHGFKMLDRIGLLGPSSR